MKANLHGMMVMAEVAISRLGREFVLNILHLFSVASPAFVYIGFGNEVLVARIVTNHTFNIHQTMHTVLPNLCLSTVAVRTFLVHWHRGVLLLGRSHRNCWQQDHEHKTCRKS